MLLVGPCDAGKTTLFHQLTHGGGQQGTVASMQENAAEGPLAHEKVCVRGGKGWREAGGGGDGGVEGGRRPKLAASGAGCDSVGLGAHRQLDSALTLPLLAARSPGCAL